VSAATIGWMPSLRMILRHCPSAWTWLSTVLMAHRHEMLGDDMQAGLRHQMMDIGHAPGHRILDRDHAERCLARADGGKRVLEGRARDGVVVRVDLA
jgi:hypothetical protein